MPDLPIELWMHIAQFLSPEEVKDLYGVNQAFYYLAMDERYREVKFHCVDSDLLHRVESLRSPEIGRRVRSFHISSHLHDPDFSSFTWLTAVLEDVVQSIMDVMPNLTKVHTYGVCWQDRGNEINPPIVDAGWTYFAPNLQHLGLSIPTSRLSTAIPLHSFQFPNLETLYIKILVEGPYVTPTADSLQALASFINQLRPHLQKLAIRSSGILDISALLLFLGKLEHLTLLELDNTGARPGSLDADPSIQFMNKNTATIRDLTLTSFKSSINFQHLRLQYLTSLLLDASMLSSSHSLWNNSLAVFFKNVSHTLKSLTILGSLYQAQLGWVFSTIEAGDLGLENGLRTLSIGATRLTRDVVVSISKILPHLDSLTLRIHDISDPSTRPVIPDDTFPELAEDPFAVWLRAVSFDPWKLRDITIKRSSCCGELFLWGLMKLFAECIPSVKSFVGNGDMMIPDPPNFQKPTEVVITCRDIVCSYGKAGMVTSREFPLRNSLLYRP